MSGAATTNLSYSAASLDIGTSRQFCEFTAALQYEQLPEPVRHECKRGMLDWLGCALAGSDTDTVRRLAAALNAAGSLPKAQVIGHKSKMGVLEAALINGQMGHVLDFDDTHMDGVVLHPLIDGVIALRPQIADFDQIASIALKVNPITVRITGIEKLQTGLQSNFSLYHCAAVACLDGVASLPQYSDARAADTQVTALRDKVSVQVEPAFGRDEAHVCITLLNGTRLEHHVDHASGTRQNPMTDAALQTKFMANAQPVLGSARSQELMQAV